MGAITTTLRPRLLKGLAMLVDLNFERSWRRRGDDRLTTFLKRGASRLGQLGLAPLFYAPTGHAKIQGAQQQGRGSRIMRLGGVSAGSGRGLGGQKKRDSCRLFRSVKLRRSTGAERQRRAAIARFEVLMKDSLFVAG